MSNIIAYSKYAKELQDGIRADLDQEVLDRAAAVSAEASARAAAVAAEATARDAAISSAVAAETSARNTAVAAANAAAAAAQADADAAQSSADAAAAAVTAEASARATAIAGEATARDAAIASAVAAETSARESAVSAEASARAADVATLTAAISAVEGGASGDTAALTARVADLETEVGANLKDTINSHLSDAVIQTTLDAYLATDSDLSGAVATAVADRITQADDIKTKVNAFIAKFFDAFVIDGVSAADYALTLEGGEAPAPAPDGGGDEPAGSGDGGAAPAPAPAPSPATTGYVLADDTGSGYDPTAAYDLSAHTGASQLTLYSQDPNLALNIWQNGAQIYYAATYKHLSFVGQSGTALSVKAGEPTYTLGQSDDQTLWLRRHPTDSSVWTMGGLHFRAAEGPSQGGAAAPTAPAGATQYFDYDVFAPELLATHSADWSGVTDNLGNLALRVYMDAASQVVGVWSRFGDFFLDDKNGAGWSAAAGAWAYSFVPSELNALYIHYYNESVQETNWRLRETTNFATASHQSIPVRRVFGRDGLYTIFGGESGATRPILIEGVSTDRLTEDFTCIIYTPQAV